MDTVLSTQDQFMRIAMARLKSTYRFKPQRCAVASKMYVEWMQRKHSENFLNASLG